jgi:hypothetical protein
MIVDVVMMMRKEEEGRDRGVMYLDGEAFRSFLYNSPFLLYCSRSDVLEAGT